MTLIKSISGIRGTIGGLAGDGFTPIDAVLYSSAFGQWVRNKTRKSSPVIVIGRDARISGEMISSLVSNSLIGMGINVIDLGLSTTPTVEFCVTHVNADAGIILTASHNPKQWNALKLLNSKGEFISASEGADVLNIASENKIEFAEVNSLGKYEKLENFIDVHIESILNLAYIQKDLIAKLR